MGRCGHRDGSRDVAPTVRHAREDPHRGVAGDGGVHHREDAHGCRWQLADGRCGAQRDHRRGNERIRGDRAARRYAVCCRCHEGAQRCRWGTHGQQGAGRPTQALSPRELREPRGDQAVGSAATAAAAAGKERSSSASAAGSAPALPGAHASGGAAAESAGVAVLLPVLPVIRRIGRWQCHAGKAEEVQLRDAPARLDGAGQTRAADVLVRRAHTG